MSDFDVASVHAWRIRHIASQIAEDANSIAVRISADDFDAATFRRLIGSIRTKIGAAERPPTHFSPSLNRSPSDERSRQTLSRPPPAAAASAFAAAAHARRAHPHAARRRQDG
jgi:hypothetical protein